jgi:hypothetical protein
MNWSWRKLFLAGRQTLRATLKDRVLLFAVVLGLAARIVFWVVTQRIWEDALITVWQARNAATGIGLTPNPAEGHIQGFTSVLSVIIPLVSELIKAGSGILSLRVATLLAFVVAVWCVNEICKDLGMGVWGRLFALAFVAFEENQVFYGMAGMETEVAVAVLLAGVLTVSRWQYKRSGVLLGLALLARPDFILWTIPALAALFRHNRKKAWPALGLTSLVIAPWIAFATWYYGSPIPHTIAAKAAAYVNPPTLSLANLGPIVHWGLAGMATDLLSVWHYLTPFLANSAETGAPFPFWFLAIIGLAISALALVGMFRVARLTRWQPLLAYLLLFLVYRGLFLPTDYYDWYIVPFAAGVAILAGIGLEQLRFVQSRLPLVFAVLLGSAISCNLAFTIPLNAVVQQQVEDRVRVPLGEYLAKVVKGSDAVFTESSGYVGYYSGATLWDYPGLISKVSAQALASIPPSQRGYPDVLGLMIEELHPHWLVLRQDEITAIGRTSPQALLGYSYLKHCEVNVPIDIGGLSWTNVDEKFWVMYKP